MSARPFELPSSIALMWIDSSIQMMRATTELWTNLLDAAPARSTASTASPWWMPPQQPLLAAPAAASWPGAFASGSWASWPNGLLPTLSAPTANPFLPWLAFGQSASASNPFAAWQQMWLQAAAPPAQWPWQAATEPAKTADVWHHPIASAYRTANGHAMAAVFRTMADVVEPKSNAFSPASFWPMTLGTRH